MSWSAQHDKEHELEQGHRIEPPEPAEREREQPLHQLASDVGNQVFGNTLAREGAGIMPTGEVHPDVQGRIDATRGSGAGLDAGRAQPLRGRARAARRRHGPHRRHVRPAQPLRLRAAFATGTDVYFAKGEYNPGSADGDRLIAHELAHVVQQRGAANTGPLTVSKPGDALETEADSVADSIA